MKHLAFIVLLVALHQSPGAAPSVITSQTPVSGGGIARWSQLWQDPGHAGNDLDGDSVCWTDFTLAYAGTIDHLEWWGAGASELGFKIEFWRQDPGTIAYQPLGVFAYGGGPSPVSPEAKFTVTSSAYSTSAGPGGITHFALDLAAPVSLPANNSSNPRWFIAIIGLTHQAYVTWNWAQGVGDSSRTFQFVRGGFDGDGAAFRSLGEGRAQLLSGTVQSPPSVGITILNGQIQITWSTNHTGYTLETAFALPATNWPAATNTITISGDQYVAPVAPVQSNQFFRLHKNP